MRINRDKLNKLAHTVADTLAEIDEVGFLEDRNTIRQEARKELETLLGTKIYLGLFVKVAPGWRDNPQQVRELDWHTQLQDLAEDQRGDEKEEAE